MVLRPWSQEIPPRKFTCPFCRIRHEVMRPRCVIIPVPVVVFNNTHSVPALHCTVLHCTASHYTALHCTALHCTVLQCTAHRNCMLHIDVACFAPTLHAAHSPLSIGNLKLGCESPSPNRAHCGVALLRACAGQRPHQ